MLQTKCRQDGEEIRNARVTNKRTERAVDRMRAIATIHTGLVSTGNMAIIHDQMAYNLNFKKKLKITDFPQNDCQNKH